LKYQGQGQILSGSLLGGFFIPDCNQKKTFNPGSRIDSNCLCQLGDPGSPEEHYQLIEVQMPFTTPIALPLRFEVETRVVILPMDQALIKIRNL
jgi:hypothetical protein